MLDVTVIAARGMKTRKSKGQITSFDAKWLQLTGLSISRNYRAVNSKRPLMKKLPVATKRYSTTDKKSIYRGIEEDIFTCDEIYANAKTWLFRRDNVKWT